MNLNQNSELSDQIEAAKARRQRFAAAAARHQASRAPSTAMPYQKL
jgi:hypothetical protein